MSDSSFRKKRSQTSKNFLEEAEYLRNFRKEDLLTGGSAESDPEIDEQTDACEFLKGDADTLLLHTLNEERDNFLNLDLSKDLNFNLVDLVELHHFGYSGFHAEHRTMWEKGGFSPSAGTMQYPTEIVRDTVENLATSIPSRALFLDNIPEINYLTSEFVYNFYLPDERVRREESSSTKFIHTSNYDTSDIAYIANNEDTPRFVRIFRDTYKFENIKAIHPSFISSFDEEGVDESLFADFVTVEGAGSNKYYTGIELVDTLADKHIYDMLESSIHFNVEKEGIDVNTKSQTELVEIFFEKLNTGKTTTPGFVSDQARSPESKMILHRVMKDLQPAGVALAKGDITEDQFRLAKDPISQQAFSVQFNNLFFSDVVEFACNSPNHVYEDELRALREPASSLQNDVISSIDPSLVYDHQYERRVQPFKIESVGLKFDIDNENFNINSNISDDSIDVSPGQSNQEAKNLIDYLIQKYPVIKIIGQVIQKFEVTPQGGVRFVKNIVIKTGDPINEIIDEDVAYGAVYAYKVRNIGLAKTIINVEMDANEDEPGLELFVGHSLVLSQGMIHTANCFENKSPPPPVGVSAIVNDEFRRPEIFWQFPVNKQRDIKKFQIFKRQKTVLGNREIAALDQPFTLLAEYDFDRSVIKTNYIESVQKESRYKLLYPKLTYIDKDFDLDFDDAIYAIVAVDVHGFSSAYSNQIHVSYDKFRNRLIIKNISGPGAPKPYPNYKIEKDFFEDVIKVSNKNRAFVFFDPEYYDIYRLKNSNEAVGNQEEDYESINAIKISSEKDDYPYAFHFINIDNQQDDTFNINIIDKSGEIKEIPASNLSQNNLSFDFGV